MGDYTVSFETFKQDVDPAPYFVGLPDNRCQCPHWGVVTAGQLTFRWADHEETYVAGDAYYAPPGHLPLVTAGTRIVEFSPTAELDDDDGRRAAEPGRGWGRRHEPASRPSTHGAGPDTSVAVANLIRFLETGSAPDGLFAPDVFADLSLPQWRIQAGTADEVLAIRADDHPFPGQVRVERVEQTDHGFTIEFEERWDNEGQRWYCREMIRADVVGRQHRRAVRSTAPATGTRPSSENTPRRYS